MENLSYRFSERRPVYEHELATIYANKGAADSAYFGAKAERSGKGADRIYTITYSVTDQAGHVTNAAATVTVKQDNSEHHDGEDEQS